MLLLIITAVVSAENFNWNSNYEQGNFILDLDAGFEDGYAFELAAYPGVEMIFFKPDFDGIRFIDIGGKLMGRVGIGIIPAALDVGIGAAGTLHFGFKDLGIDGLSEYLDPFDFFGEFGICFDFLHSSTYMFGAVVNSGFNYFLDDGFSLGLKYTHWNGYDGGTISARMTFKDKAKAEKAVDKKLND